MAPGASCPTTLQAAAQQFRPAFTDPEHSRRNQGGDPSMSAASRSWPRRLSSGSAVVPSPLAPRLAQSFPIGRGRLVLSYPPGGAPDLVARRGFGQPCRAARASPWLVENGRLKRNSAGEMVVNAAPTATRCCRASARSHQSASLTPRWSIDPSRTLPVASWFRMPCLSRQIPSSRRKISAI